MSNTSRAYKLVPYDLYRKLVAAGQKQEERTDTTPAEDPTPSTAIAVDEDDEEAEHQESIDSVINYLPKSYRRKARIILEAGRVPFDSHTYRVTYSDGEVGSHLVSLLSYFLAPRMISTKTKNVPPDADRFLELLQSTKSIPPNLYNTKIRKSKKKLSFTWLTLR